MALCLLFFFWAKPQLKVQVQYVRGPFFSNWQCQLFSRLNFAPVETLAPKYGFEILLSLMLSSCYREYCVLGRARTHVTLEANIQECSCVCAISEELNYRVAPSIKTNSTLRMFWYTCWVKRYLRKCSSIAWITVKRSFCTVITYITIFRSAKLLLRRCSSISWITVKRSFCTATTYITIFRSTKLLVLYFLFNAYF